MIKLKGKITIIDALGFSDSRLLKTDSEIAEELKSRGTTNLLDQLNEDHGKFVWFLRSFTE